MNTHASQQPGKDVPPDDQALKLGFRAESQGASSQKQKDEKEKAKLSKTYTLSLLLASLRR